MLKLPITQFTIDDFVASSSKPDTLCSLPPIQLATLICVAKAQDLQIFSLNDDLAQERLEKTLADLINIINEGQEEALLAAATQTIERLESREGSAFLNKIVKGLSKKAIFLMTAEEIAQRSYLTIEKQWKYGQEDSNTLADDTTKKAAFSQSRVATIDQQRILSVFAAEADEGMHIQGFAGTGKTHLITEMAEIISQHWKPEQVLLLALSPAQLEAMTQKLPFSCAKFTYASLARKVLHPVIRPEQKFELRSQREFTVHFQELSDLMGYSSIGHLYPNQVAETVTKTVNRFCYSNDDEVQEQHLPRYLKNQLSPANLAILVTLANQLWATILEPSNGIILPIRGYHQVKLWALSGLGLPKQFSHVFIDETHDLPEVIAQIIDRSPQATITLGDEYQAISPTQNRDFVRSPRIRHKSMETSFRAGKNTSTLYNDILSHHPNKPDREFVGGDHKTTTIKYDVARTRLAWQAHYATLLSRTHWHLLESIIELTEEEAPFYILRQTKNDLLWLVKDAILFCQQSIRPKHREFYRYTSWEDFKAGQSKDIQHIIENTIENDLTLERFASVLAKESNTPDPSKMFILARVEDAKNLEFNRVMVLDDLMNLNDHSSYSQALAMNLIYVAVSRAKNEIILPSQLEDWVANPS